MFHSNYVNVDVIIVIPSFSEGIITQLCGALDPIVSTIFQHHIVYSVGRIMVPGSSKICQEDGCQGGQRHRCDSM